MKQAQQVEMRLVDLDAMPMIDTDFEEQCRADLSSLSKP